MKIKAAIFDLDGTLLDSMGFWDNLGEDFLMSQGREPREDFREKYYVLSPRETAQMLIDEYDVSGTPDEIIEKMDGAAEVFYTERVKAKPHAIELLERLKAAGIKIALATATDRHLVEIAVNRLDIKKYFEGIVTCGEVGQSKTRPDVYLKALSYTGCEISETALFEDAVVAAHTAKDAGFYTVGVYDDTCAENEEEMRSFCDEYVTDFSDSSFFNLN